MIRKDIVTRSLVSGAELTIPVFHFQGTNPNASSVYIQSSIHGAEVQGYIVALLLIEHFINHPPENNITIVPLANPHGINQKMGEYTFGRFDPSTGDNWNRNYVDFSYLVDDFLAKHSNKQFDELIGLFKKEIHEKIKSNLEKPMAYHKKLALELQSMSSQADIILDLHCGGITVPYIYCPTYAMQSALKLGVPYIVEIPDNKFGGALDEASFRPFIQLMEKYNELNPSSKVNYPIIEAMTIELGDQEVIDLQTAEKQSKLLLKYLSKNAKKNEVTYSCKLEDFQTIYAPIGGLIINHAELGKELEPNQPIFTISSPKLFSKAQNSKDFVKNTSVNINLDYKVIPINMISSANIHEAMALLMLMKNYKKLS